MLGEGYAPRNVISFLSADQLTKYLLGIPGTSKLIFVKSKANFPETIHRIEYAKNWKAPGNASGGNCSQTLIEKLE